eukprot:3944922-Pyramimonas_sp.AAC.1
MLYYAILRNDQSEGTEPSFTVPGRVAELFPIRHVVVVAVVVDDVVVAAAVGDVVVAAAVVGVVV